MTEGKLKKRIKQDSFIVPRSEDSTFSGHVIKWQTGWRLIDEAKKDFVKQSISLKDATTVLKDVDQTRIICFPVETFVKWFGDDSD